MMAIPALFAGLGGTAAAAGGAAATAGLFGTGLSAASILSGVATVGGVLATLGAANAQADSYNNEAAQTQLDAVTSDTAAVQKNTAMKRELMRVLGENAVTAAASGIDVGSGIAADQAYQAKATAATEISIDRSTQDARRAMFRARAAGLRQMAASAQSAGMWTAFGQLAQGGADIAKRGGY
jgi:hypothetical protein